MYYVPVKYYGIHADIYKIVRNEIKKKVCISRKNYYNKNISNNRNYIEYKSNLIRLILIDHAYKNPNDTGYKLLNKIINNLDDHSIINIKKYERTINNLEEILMLIDLQILENY